MNTLKFLLNFSLVSVMLIIGIFGYKKLTQKAPALSLYKTEQPQKRTIKHEINTSGILEIQNTMKIGSQLAGIVKEVLVKENQHVKKGTVLALIETGKEDKDIKFAEQNLNKTEREFLYQESNFKRQQQLYLANQISKNTYERIKADFEKARADRNAQKVTLEKAILEYQYIKVRAPDDGIITAVNISKGTAVLNDFQYVIFEIAHDITQMKATLDIDESEIGYVKPGQKVKLTINSFPDQPIHATLSDISYTPKAPPGKNGDSVQFYKATVTIANNDMRLRPGMMVNARITVEKNKDVTSISGLAFQINPEILELIAKKLNVTYKPLPSAEKKAFKIAHAGKKFRYVWTLADKAFTQKAVILGTTDNNHWQIIDGISENDNIINDIQEPNEMDKLYKAWFKGSL